MSPTNFFNKTNPEIHAVDLRYKFKIAPGVVDLNTICNNLDIEIVEDDLGASGNVCGCLVKDGNSAIILINSYLENLGRKRFTIAHELGHFIIPNHNNTTYQCDRFRIEEFGNRNQETEANIFASELLFPTKEAKEIVRKHSVSSSLIEKHAELYGMSLSAVAVKLVKLTQDDTCAVILSENHKVRWSVKSPRFLKKGLEIKKDIQMTSISKNKEHPSHYLFGSYITNIPFISVQTIPFTNLGMELSIIAIPDNDEEDDDWDES